MKSFAENDWNPMVAQRGARAVLLAVVFFAPLEAQNGSGTFVSDEIGFSKFVRVSNLRAAVIESGRIVWHYGDIKAAAPEEPVIAERLERLAERGRISLDDPVKFPQGATIRQVLSHTADGKPGEEVLDNRAFFDALKPIAGSAPLPIVVQFASEDHGALGWFSQQYGGERVVWSYDRRVLVVRVPGKNRTLVVSANSPAMIETARLEDGNVLRSKVALMFLNEVAGLGAPGGDSLIDEALALLHGGEHEQSTKLVHQALEKFPALESTPDVTLLYLFAQLGLPETEASATAVIRNHPSLPTAWYYYGQYLLSNKRYREAAACFEQITMHQPPWHHWTVTAAARELKYLQ